MLRSATGADRARRGASCRRSFRPGPLAPLLLVVALLATAGGARARVLFDFEPPYLREEGRAIKDHTLVRDGDTWHVFYTRGRYTSTGTVGEVSFGHATSSDLRDWTLHAPVLPVEPGTWNDLRVWAPYVIPAPGGSGWTLFYTGVTDGLVQRMGRADSPDLFQWTRSAGNPELEPDPGVYYWSPGIAFLSAFRDPFVFEQGGVYHAINTVLLRDATAVNGFRGALHHATSTDLVDWTPLDPLAVNRSTTGGVNREIESSQLVPAAGGWNLFFTFSQLTGVRWMRSATFDAGWSFATAQVLDPDGVAAELTPLGADTFLFTRYGTERHSNLHPSAGLPFFVIRADTLRIDAQGTPRIVSTDVLAREWPEREGTAFAAAPVFGDNALERDDMPARPIGNGHLSSRETYLGPLAVGGGAIGEARPLADTGRIRSIWFSVGATDSVLSFLLAGSDDPGARLELVQRLSAEGAPLVTQTVRVQSATGSDRLQPFAWDVSDLRGAVVRLELIDETTTGYVALDFVEMRDTAEIPVAVPPRPDGGIRSVRAVPNPFNPRTRIEYELEGEARVRVEVIDARGRRVRGVDLGPHSRGTHAWVWDGTDDAGAPVASGVYLLRASTSEGARGARAVLVR